MEKDIHGGGTEADGTRSQKYCSLCYADGGFTNPDLTSAKQMQDFCILKLKEQGMPGVMGWLFTRGIPRLERWRH